MGSLAFDFGPGESLLITMDVPTVSQITIATPAAPYYSLVFELDIALIESLVAEISSSQAKSGEAVQVEKTEEEVADVLLRMMKLFSRPASMPILQQSLVRELHYWLLTGRHGAAILALLAARLQQRQSAYAVLFDALLSLSGSEVEPDALQMQVEKEARDDTPAALDAVWEEEQIKFLGEQGCTSAQQAAHQRRFSGAVVPQYLDVAEATQRSKGH